MDWKWYVYILECNDGSYYTGMTWRISSRLDQHFLKNGCKYTREHGVRRLLYVEEHSNHTEARERERQIKGWTRMKKEKLISGEWTM
ncbi:hypothetical protein A3C17_00005 [Candidatus Uhrbacteria bacterium RIFCSPHIGHO2_02_FULL_53_13]|uniref:GIY-YIG domain-containing protein n=1 Tax=Candidatus Uhrbacteria bacterium RIFCSPHIGHO2_02_FULL_53_13 TaxID=1802389 RepID=A0A1F7U2T7_9BACT|nr:MAG: hypothetical protein A3C17_00005 [Candidatus Uhrbacteria bacterium RIFCSPHIGHO2_02_FULL_53_13]